MNRVILMTILSVLGFTTINSCKKDAPPTAKFTISGGDCFVTPCKVHFENNSKRADSYLWDFGDGTSSSQKSPLHTYKEEGYYKITLTTKNSNGSANAVGYVKVGNPDKVFVTHITIANMPIGQNEKLNLSFNITDIDDNVIWDGKSSVINNVTFASFPVTWELNPPFEINDFKTYYSYDIWNNRNKYKGSVGFRIKDYIGFSYPKVIYDTQNDLTIELDLMWE